MPKIKTTIRAKLRAKEIDLPRPIYRYLLARGAIRTRPYRHRPAVPDEKKSDDQGGIMQ